MNETLWFVLLLVEYASSFGSGFGKGFICDKRFKCTNRVQVFFMGSLHTINQNKRRNHKFCVSFFGFAHMSFSIFEVTSPKPLSYHEMVYTYLGSSIKENFTLNPRLLKMSAVLAYMFARIPLFPFCACS